MKKIPLIGLMLAIVALGLLGHRMSEQSTWKITATGLKLDDFFWCDSAHLAVQYKSEFRRHYDLGMLDVAHPEQVLKTELPDGAEPDRPQHLMGCDDHNTLIVSTITAADPRESVIYALYPDGSNSVLAKPKLQSARVGRNRSVSLDGKVIVAVMPRYSQGNAYVADEQCATYAAPGFKVLCFDSYSQRLLALRRFAIVDYLDDPPYLSLRNGTPASAQDPAPPRYDKAGERIVKAAYLHGLDRQMIARLDEDAVFQVERMGFAVDPSETWLYAPCKYKDKSEAYRNDFDRVCRYRLDGVPHPWEQVFASELASRTGRAIQNMGIDAHANVYFDMPGSTGPDGGIWKFDAASSKVEHILVTRRHEYFANPVVAADGHTILFEQNNNWNIAREH